MVSGLLAIGSSAPAFASTGQSQGASAMTAAAIQAALQQNQAQQQAQLATGQGEDAGLRPGANPADPASLPFAPAGTVPPGSLLNSPLVDSALTAATVPTRTNFPTAYGTDIALGKPYTITTQYPDSFFMQTQASFPDVGQLTSGKYGSLSFQDPAWIGLYRQYGRTITINLGQKENIQALSLDFLQETAAGITFPGHVTYQVSQDGVNWATVGTATSTIGSWVPGELTQAYEVPGLDINAQYVRAEFNVAVFAFTDAFSIFGSTTPNPQGQTPVGQPAPPTPDPGYLPAGSPQTGGIHNMLLAYTDANGSLGTWTVSDFLPMLESPGSGTQPPSSPQPGNPTGPGQPPSGSQPGQPSQPPSGSQPGQPGPPTTGSQPGQPPAGSPPPANPLPGTPASQTIVSSKHGTLAKRFFDAIHRHLGPSGRQTQPLFDGVLFANYGIAGSELTWSNYIQNLFTSGIQLSALNQAVAQAGTTPEKVVINIPGLDGDPTAFGSLTPGGPNLDMNPAIVGQTVAYQNKLLAIQWYINTVMADWKQAGYAHLQLEGFYWSPESLNIKLEYKHAIIEQTAAMVHADHLLFYWIPFYGGAGIPDWRQLGFDDVMVQAGVAFNFSINPLSRFTSVSQLAETQGLGVEMEFYWNALSVTNLPLAQHAQDRWFDYLTAGNVFGWEGNGLVSYYDSSKNFTQAAENPDPLYHQIYTTTTSYIANDWRRTSFVRPVAATITGLSYAMPTLSGLHGTTSVVDMVTQPIVLDNYGDYMADLGTYTLSGPTGHQGILIDAGPYSVNNLGAGNLTVGTDATVGQYTVTYTLDAASESAQVGVGTISLTATPATVTLSAPGVPGSVTSAVYSAVTANVYNPWGLPVGSIGVDFSTNFGTLGAPSMLTDDGGAATDVLSAANPGTATVIGNVYGLTGSATISFIPYRPQGH